MACCLGLRCKDIKNLKIEHFHWEEKRLVFTQSKTRQLISLLSKLFSITVIKEISLYKATIFGYAGTKIFVAFPLIIKEKKAKDTFK